MKILITGSSGFIGSNLAHILRKDNKNEIVEYDLAHDQSESLDNLSLFRQKTIGVDIIYHLAAICDPNSLDLYKVNVVGTRNLARIAQDKNIKVIFASTFGVYKIPQKGHLINEDDIINPRNEYCKSKWEAEKYILDDKQNIVMRFSNVYGPSILPGKHSVVANFINAIVNEKPVVIYNKKASRDFIYIDDLIKALIKAGQSKESGILNICSGEETGILDLVKIIEKKIKKKAVINLINSSNSDGYWRGDYSKAKKYLNWYPQVRISQGLARTINKFK